MVPVARYCAGSKGLAPIAGPLLYRMGDKTWKEACVLAVPATPYSRTAPPLQGVDVDVDIAIVAVLLLGGWCGDVVVVLFSYIVEILTYL